MEKFINVFNKNGFIYFGVYIDAFKNEKNELKKRPLMPNKNKLGANHEYVKKSFLDNVYDKNCGIQRKPNAIAIITHKSNLMTIDIDKPDKCIILDKLLNDCKFYVKTRQGYHFYFKNDNSDIPRNKHCGIADINTDLLFFCPEYREYNIESCNDKEYTTKEGRKGVVKHFEGYTLKDEVYKYELIKSDDLVIMPEYVKDWCKQLIVSNIDIDKTIKKKPIGINKIINPNTINERFNIKIMTDIYDILFKYEYFSNYDKWIQTTYMSRHLNNTEEGFKLFDTYSRKVDAYKNNNEYVNRQFFYGQNKYDLNFDETGVLILCSKLDKGMYKKTLKSLDISKYEKYFNYIDHKYIYNDDTDKNMFKDWVKNGYVLMIKSQYGTGKTFAFKKLVDKYKYKKILFITYRQSLANSLSKELKNVYKFDNYLDNRKDNLDIRKSDRLIIQLDSLGKICDYEDFCGNNDIPEFDLLVLDEIEGVLNHLSYNKINQHLIYSYLTGIIKNAGKVLCLDGDMGDRSFDFINNITDNYKIFINSFQPNKKTFNFTTNLKMFDESIETDLKNGKNIVIVSMTKSDTEKYNKYYKDKYKVILHNGLERNRHILEDVNEEWKKAQLLIYSPTIESGVDFNVENHFYKCYGVLTNKSNTYRAFSQMLNRVRFYESNDILCYLGDVKYNDNYILYRYEEIKMKYKDIEITPLINTLIHNDVERINNKAHFYACLTKMLKHKGHICKVLEKPVFKRKDKNVDIMASIIDSKDIETSEYKELLEKQRCNKDLTRDENLAVEKMIYKKKWLVDTIDTEFLDKHYKKNDVLRNYKLLNLKEDERDVLDTEILKRIKFKKIDKVKDLINKLGFNIDDGVIVQNKVLSNDDYKKVVEETINNKTFKIYFSNDRQLKTQNHNQHINSILNNYGYKMEKIRKSKKVNKKVISIDTPNLIKLDIIVDYLIREEAKGKPNKDVYIPTLPTDLDL